MFQQYFQHQGIVTLPILTMLLFAAVFLAVLVRSLRRRPDEQVACLPLQEELQDRPAATGHDAEGAHG